MKFGIFDYVEVGDNPIGRIYDERFEFVRAAESAGFQGYYVSEHHFTPQSLTPSPSVYLAALARETKRIRLGALLFLLPLYHPLRLAEELCMLDHLSGGRLDIGVGRGVSPVEFAALGEDYDESAEVYTEVLELLIKCFTSERVDHDGKKWKFQNVPMVMKPLQKPYPPLWYGLRGESGGVLAAHYGMNAIASGTDQSVAAHLARFREAWRLDSVGRKNSQSPVLTPVVGGMRNVVVADTDAEAERLGRAAYQSWYDNLKWLWIQSGQSPPTGFSSDYEVARKTGSLVVGSPSAVLAELSAQVKRCGYEYLVMVMNFGSLNHQQAMRSLELFRDEVMPALRELGSRATFPG